MKPKLTRAEISALGGRAGSGKAKKRGSTDYYHKLSLKRWKKNK